MQCLNLNRYLFIYVTTGERTYIPPHRRQSTSSPTGTEDNNNEDFESKHHSTSFNDRQFPSYGRSSSYTVGPRTPDRRRSDGYGGGYSRRGGNSSTFVNPTNITRVIILHLYKLEFQKSQSVASYSQHDSRFRTPNEVEEDWLSVKERNHEYERFVLISFY